MIPLNVFRALTVLSVALFVGAASVADASIHLTPASIPSYTTTNNSNLGSWADIETAFGFNIADDLALLYKANAGGADEGPFQLSYNTNFVLDSENEPVGATINYVLTSAFIDIPTIYLLVKDGVKGNPAQFLFDISDWNGTETIQLSGFWDGVKGAISNVAIWGGGTPPPPPPDPGGGPEVPEPTAIFVWFVLIGSIELVAVRVSR